METSNELRSNKKFWTFAIICLAGVAIIIWAQRIDTYTMPVLTIIKAIALFLVAGGLCLLFTNFMTPEALDLAIFGPMEKMVNEAKEIKLEELRDYARVEDKLRCVRKYARENGLEGSARAQEYIDVLEQKLRS